MELNNDNMEADVAAFAALLSKKGNMGYRRYRLERKDGRLMLIRDEIDRIFESVMSEVFGTELAVIGTINTVVPVTTGASLVLWLVQAIVSG
jgi:hypothetical protein